MAKTALLRILRIKTQGPFNLGIPSKYPFFDPCKDFIQKYVSDNDL